MKILLTGATGFIGKNLLPVLRAAGHGVDTLWRFDSPEEFDRVRYDAVVHLGWEGVSAPHRQDWARQTRNVARFGRLLAMCDFWKPKVFVGFGSQAEYGIWADRSGVNDREFALPICAYGHTKHACGEFLKYHAIRHGYRRVWLRPFSVYGPGEAADWLIPATIRRMRQGDPLEFTRGEQEMDYLHVTDVCAGIRAAVENEGVIGNYDLATGAPVKLRTMIEMLWELVGEKLKAENRNPPPPVFGALPYRPGQIMRMCADTTFWTHAGLKPTIALRDGLKELVGKSETLKS